MEHFMNLNSGPFERIKSGQKNIEVRCKDEKRRKIKVNDYITFTKLPEQTENLRVRVLDLYPCKTFYELYSLFDFSEFGCKDYTMRQMLDGTRSIYSRE